MSTLCMIDYDDWSAWIYIKMVLKQNKSLMATTEGYIQVGSISNIYIKFDIDVCD